MCVLTTFGHDSHLGHVTSIMLMNFHFLVPERLRTQFVGYGPEVSVKSKI